MTWLKDMMRPLFADELRQLDSCQQEIYDLTVQLTECRSRPAETIVTEVPVYRDVREFSSYEELRLWLRANPVSEQEYHVPEQDCDDFARQTQQAALADGYLINVEYDPSGFYQHNGKPHMLCSAIIRDHIFVFDPQTDLWVMDSSLD